MSAEYLIVLNSVQLKFGLYCILFIVNIHCVHRKVNGIFSNTIISVLLLLLFSISFKTE